VPYVIVTSEELAPTFQKLADWKRSVGMPAQVVTVEWLGRSAYYPGVDMPERLYRLLQDLRLNWRTRWVLLGGGVDAVPTQRIRAYKQALGGNQIASDVYYADILPEARDDPDRIGAYGWNGNGDRFVGEADKDGFDSSRRLRRPRAGGTPAEGEGVPRQVLCVRRGEGEGRPVLSGRSSSVRGGSRRRRSGSGPVSASWARRVLGRLVVEGSRNPSRRSRTS
jgi:hypothetical protein